MLGHVGPCWAKTGVFIWGLKFKPQMNTLFLGHVGGMLGLCWAMLGQEQRVHLVPKFRPQMYTLFPGHVGAMFGLCWAMLGLC